MDDAQAGFTGCHTGKEKMKNIHTRPFPYRWGKHTNIHTKRELNVLYKTLKIMNRHRSIQ